MSPWEAARMASDLCEPYELNASLHIRMTKGPPGLQQTDDDWVANRVAEAVTAACAFEGVHVYADTFADVDRGYYRRHGVVDRFYNPRPGFEVVRQLLAVFAQVQSFSPSNVGKNITVISNKGERFTLLQQTSPRDWEIDTWSGWLIDLYTGNRVSVKHSSNHDVHAITRSPLSLWKSI